MEVVMNSVHETTPIEGKVKEEVVVVVGPRRPIADYHPTVWGDYFITHSPPPHPHHMTEAQVTKRVEEMVEEVKGMLRDGNDLLQELQLIDALERLGVSYRFEEEINERLTRIKDEVRITGGAYNGDLHAVSLWFRLLRQNGFNVSSDVFNQFKDEEGKFKAILGKDVKGLLSLYEAAHLGVLQETILDDAIDFTRMHLEPMVEHLEQPLADLVSQALESPLIRRMKRLAAKSYISIYKDYKEIRNDTVLELAMLDYHLVQLLHWEEVRSICVWMKELGIMDKLSFVRHRMVELYFWILGVYFEPCYSRSRMMMTKVITLTSTIDDLYDSYGTLDELELYTDAIQRWEPEAVEQLPEYIKFQFLTLVNTVKEFEDELAAEGLSYRVDYLKLVMKNIVNAYYKEAKWREEKYVPTVEEHLTVSLVTSGHPMLSCASYVGMGYVATKEAFEWVIRFPRILEASSKVARFMDDVAGHEFEQSRDHVVSLVECYVKENNITDQQEAHKKLHDVVEIQWRIMNEACLDPTVVPRPLLAPVVNLARMIETFHKYIDAYTHSATFMRDRIEFVLVQPVPI